MTLPTRRLSRAFTALCTAGAMLASQAATVRYCYDAQHVPSPQAVAAILAPSAEPPTSLAVAVTFANDSAALQPEATTSLDTIAEGMRLAGFDAV